MKKNILKSASLAVGTAFLFCAVLTSCNNSGSGSNSGDSGKMKNGDTPTMNSNPMQDTMKKPCDTCKGDQKSPPRD